jgi:hypothetical protein
MADAGHNTCKYVYTWIMSADADINIHRTMLYAYDTIKLIRPFKMKSNKLNSDPFPSLSKALTQVVFSQPCYLGRMGLLIHSLRIGHGLFAGHHDPCQGTRELCLACVSYHPGTGIRKRFDKTDLMSLPMA